MSGEQSELELSKSLSAVLKRAGVPSEFKDWCKKKKLIHPIDIALLASKEEDIERKIMLACKSEVQTVDELNVEVSIRKAWLFSREAMNHPSGAKKDELEAGEHTAMDDAWFNKYRMRLSTRERVGKPLLTKLARIVFSDPPEFEIFLLEQITLYAHCPKSVDQVVKSANDGSLHTNSQQVEAVTSGNVVFERVKVLVYSFAYVSIERSDWCDFSVVRTCVEELWTRVQKAQAAYAPVS